MTNEQIDLFLTPTTLSNLIHINFKKRDAIRGIFLTINDFEDLKTKNLWRVVSESKVEEWHKTKDMGLTRIYNGTDFLKLKVL